MKKSSGLGRGLDALLGDYQVSAKTGMQDIDIRLIDTNPEQPRKSFDEDRLRELGESLKLYGMVQPIVAKQNGERFTIVTGERRYRAARMAGIETVPVVVREFDEKEIMEVALIENIQREDLNPVEEAAAIAFLMEQHDLTQEEVSSRLAKSRPAITNSLRLLSLPEVVKAHIRDGRLSAGHGRALAGLDDEELQIELAEHAVVTHCSVRALEKLCKQTKTEVAQPKKTEKQAGELYDIESRLRDRFQTKIKITGNSKKGKILIEYHNQDELENVLRVLGE